jgi:protein-S-isoprenylcysteine O-methyltransferase
MASCAALAFFALAPSPQAAAFWAAVAATICLELRTNLRPHRGERGVAGFSHAASSLSLACVGASVAALILAEETGDSPSACGPRLEIAGTGAMVAGTLLRLWVARTLGRRFTYSITILPGHCIETGGVFRIVRHPAYAGSILFISGLALACRSPLAAILALLLAVVIYPARIRIEERILVEEFGDAYRAYQARTWRLVPLIY